MSARARGKSDFEWRTQLDNLKAIRCRVQLSMFSMAELITTDSPTLISFKLFVA